MATKNRSVYLMQYLQENSDENHPVTTARIRDEMAKRGCPIIISTLRDDIESLRNAGYDIQVNETEGSPVDMASIKTNGNPSKRELSTKMELSWYFSRI